jgi:hypothetical protein
LQLRWQVRWQCVQLVPGDAKRSQGLWQVIWQPAQLVVAKVKFFKIWR